MRKEAGPKKSTQERKSSPLVRQKETPAEATAHRVPRREIKDDTTTSDSEEGEVEVLATAKKSFKHDLDSSSSEGGEQSSTDVAVEDLDKITQKRKDRESELRERWLEEENKKLRLTVTSLQKRNQELGSERLNELMKTQLGRYVKETLFRKVKFVNSKKLEVDSKVMRQCMSSIGVTDERASEYSKEVQKYLKYYLTQRRNYVIQNLKTIVMSKFSDPNE